MVKEELHIQSGARSKFHDHGETMKTYLFRIEVEPDEEGWRAFCPPLEALGASTWGDTKEVALHNIQEVLSMIVEEAIGGNQPIPLTEDVTVSEGAFVTVSL